MILYVGVAYQLHRSVHEQISPIILTAVRQPCILTGFEMTAVELKGSLMK